MLSLDEQELQIKELDSYLLKLKQLQNKNPAKKLVSRKEHLRQISLYKIIPVRSTEYYMRGGRTEVNTSEHKSFCKAIYYIVDGYSTRSKEILFLSDIDYASKVKYEERIGYSDSSEKIRICDILVKTYVGRNICIECQLSNISHKDLRARSLHYLNHNYEVVWVIKCEENIQIVYLDILLEFKKKGYFTKEYINEYYGYGYYIISRGNNGKK